MTREGHGDFAFLRLFLELKVSGSEQHIRSWCTVVGVVKAPWAGQVSYSGLEPFYFL
jgi:hypothetical protein